MRIWFDTKLLKGIDMQVACTGSGGQMLSHDENFVAVMVHKKDARHLLTLCDLGQLPLGGAHQPHSQLAKNLSILLEHYLQSTP